MSQQSSANLFSLLAQLHSGLTKYIAPLNALHLPINCNHFALHTSDTSTEFELLNPISQVVRVVTQLLGVRE